MKSTVNSRIKQLRTALGLNQQEFALECDLSTSLISKVESGEREASFKVTDAICQAFRVDESWLVQGLGEMSFVKRKKEDMTQINPWKDALVVELKQNADTWKQKYEQVFARLEFLMDRLPLGKRRPVNGTALGLRLTGTGQMG